MPVWRAAIVGSPSRRCSTGSVLFEKGDCRGSAVVQMADEGWFGGWDALARAVAKRETPGERRRQMHDRVSCRECGNG